MFDSPHQKVPSEDARRGATPAKQLYQKPTTQSQLQNLYPNGSVVRSARLTAGREPYPRTPDDAVSGRFHNPRRYALDVLDVEEIPRIFRVNEPKALIGLHVNDCARYLHYLILRNLTPFWVQN